MAAPMLRRFPRAGAPWCAYKAGTLIPLQHFQAALPPPSFLLYRVSSFSGVFHVHFPPYAWHLFA